MCLNRTSDWKVMTIWISQELTFFNFERVDILGAQTWHPCEKLWPVVFLESFCCLISSVSTYYALESDIRVKSDDHLNFSRASVVQFRASRYVMRLNRTSELNVMTIGISQELMLFNFERVDILCAQTWHPCEKLWPVEFLDIFFCLISSVSTYYVLESDIRVKSYDHLNFSRAYVV